jgi:hypothetical protein
LFVTDSRKQIDMDALVEALLNFPTSKEGIEGYMNNLRSRSDVIVSAGTSVAGASTALLSTLSSIRVDHCTPGYALLLSLQSEALVDATRGEFLTVCRNFLQNANPQQIPCAYAEGNTRHYIRFSKCAVKITFCM